MHGEKDEDMTGTHVVARRRITAVGTERDGSRDSTWPDFATEERPLEEVVEGWAAHLTLGLPDGVVTHPAVEVALRRQLSSRHPLVSTTATELEVQFAVDDDSPETKTLMSEVALFAARLVGATHDDIRELFLTHPQLGAMNREIAKRAFRLVQDSSDL